MLSHDHHIFSFLRWAHTWLLRLAFILWIPNSHTVPDSGVVGTTGVCHCAWNNHCFLTRDSGSGIQQWAYPYYGARQNYMCWFRPQWDSQDKEHKYQGEEVLRRCKGWPVLSRQHIFLCCQCQHFRISFYCLHILTFFPQGWSYDFMN